MLEFLHFYKLDKLNKLCKIKVSPTLVWEFYVNLRLDIKEGENQDVVFLREKRMKLNAVVINEFFGIEPIEDFSVSDIDNVCLTIDIAVISG